MVQNYLKLAWRNILRHKFYSLLNITGLATGLVVCILIMFYVAHEMSYDRFHKNADRIYKLAVQVKMSGDVLNMDQFSFATGPLIKQSQPAVRDYLRTFDLYKKVVVRNPSDPERNFSDKDLLYADAGFFNFFTFKLVSGNPANVLSKPFSIVISKDIAKKYFGTEYPVGKTLTIKTDSIYNYQVTGIAENCPSNSSVRFNFVASASSLQRMGEAHDFIASQRVEPGNLNSYVLLNPGADTAKLAHNIALMTKDNKDYPDEKFRLLPLKDVHLSNSILSDGKYLKTFPLIAGLILLLALINYMSLATARAAVRSKEIGVRKVLGAKRGAISTQFYVESALITGISFVLGYGLCYLFKPWFFSLVGVTVDYSFLYSPLVLVWLLVLFLLTVAIAGSYPSIILSSFQPIAVLKGKMSKSSGGISVRKIFTTFQFAISVGLIICGIVIGQQLYFFRHADTGIDRNNVMDVPVAAGLGKGYVSLKNEIAALPGVEKVGISHYDIFGDYEITFVQGKNKSESLQLASLKIDENYIAALGLQWLNRPVPSDDLAAGKKIVINKAAAEKLQLPPDPIGSFIASNGRRYQVAGVLKNFNYNSMQYSVDPMAFMITPDTSSYFSSNSSNLFIKIKPHTNLSALIGTLQNIYKKYDRVTPFSFTFVDDVFNQLYVTEEKLAAMFNIFIAVAISLAVLGLFGLSAFTTEQRMKEISIHKILGATGSTINRLLFGDFLRLILLAIVIASPFAAWAMHSWLQGFAYRISIKWWVFMLSGSFAFIIAAITISYHAIKVSRANPVNSLRSE